MAILKKEGSRIACPVSRTEHSTCAHHQPRAETIRPGDLQSPENLLGWPPPITLFGSGALKSASRLGAGAFVTPRAWWSMQPPFPVLRLDELSLMTRRREQLFHESGLAASQYLPDTSLAAVLLPLDSAAMVILCYAKASWVPICSQPRMLYGEVRASAAQGAWLPG